MCYITCRLKCFLPNDILDENWDCTVAKLRWVAMLFLSSVAARARKSAAAAAALDVTEAKLRLVPMLISSARWRLLSWGGGLQNVGSRGI